MRTLTCKRFAYSRIHYQQFSGSQEFLRYKQGAKCYFNLVRNSWNRNRLDSLRACLGQLSRYWHVSFDGISFDDHAFGPLFDVPLSVAYGPHGLFFGAHGMFAPFNVGTARAQDIITVQVLRFLIGVSGFSPLSISDRVLVDMLPPL